MDFVTVIEHNVRRVNLPANLYQLIGPTLPRDCYFFLDIGGIVPGVLHRRTGNIHTNTSLICQAYEAVESVEASITYTVEGRFNVVRIMPQEDDAGSDSTDSDYQAFLDDYDGSDSESDAGMDAGSDAEMEAWSDVGSNSGSDVGSDSGSDADSQSVVTDL